MGSRATKGWYLVYAKVHQERVAQENLARQGYETYLPLMRQVRKRSGRRATSITPMFPRYLFIHLDSQSDNWGPIRSTLGVVSLVRFGRNAAQVPNDLVVALRQREDEQGIQVVPSDDYQPGSRVRITDGSFAGYEGVFLAKSGRDRVVLLLDILGKHTRAVVGVDVIEPGG
jgi:transcriptional antiterminator RfaH